MGYDISAEVFYGIKVYFDLEDSYIDDYRKNGVVGRSTGCRMTGKHITDWLVISDSSLDVVDYGSALTDPIAISELKIDPEWDGMLLQYAKEIGVLAESSPGWFVTSSGG